MPTFLCPFFDFTLSGSGYVRSPTTGAKLPERQGGNFTSGSGAHHAGGDDEDADDEDDTPLLLVLTSMALQGTPLTLLPLP